VSDTAVGPSYTRYLASLPGGLATHPDAQAKASLVRAFLEGQPADVLRRLPEPLQPLVREPPIENAWIPEVQFCAFFHALCEALGHLPAARAAWIRSRNQSLFSGPLYRLLMTVASPERVLREAARRWGVFHRGSALDFEGFSDDGARVRLAFPPGLFDAFMLDAFSEAFAAALESARAKDPLVQVEASGPGFARFVARW
jgi:hypothetical protein